MIVDFLETNANSLKSFKGTAINLVAKPFIKKLFIFLYNKFLSLNKNL